MGIDHSFKDDDLVEHSFRCPYCKHVSTEWVKDDTGRFWYCKNPRCEVEKIYGSNAVMVISSVMDD